MRVMVTTEARLIKTPDGNIYGLGPISYGFLSRYLKVFDEVIVFARVKEVDDVQPNKFLPAEGEGVRIFCLPCYLGPWEFIRRYNTLKALAKQALNYADAYVLRVPGMIGTLLWHHLMKNKIPYGVEVVGDPWDSLAPGSVKTILRPLLRRKMRRELVSQCRNATVASYVTEYSLQKRYPPGCWSTHYSSIELPDEHIIDESQLQERFLRNKQKVKSGEPWVLCYVGTMSQLYKAPDIVIRATASVIKQGGNVELVLVGDGRFRPQLEKQAKLLGIRDNVEFIGWVLPGKAVFDQFDKADLFVLPSRQEGLPRTAIEAMARGLPCIGSTVGGFAELLEPENLVTPNEPEQLACKIREMLSDIKRLNSISKRNLELVKSKYHLQELNKRRLEFYKRLKAAP